MVKKRRLKLQRILESYCNKVYFQPGANVTLTYPCIVYHVSDVSVDKADNLGYKSDIGYDVTYITRDVDSDIPIKMITEIPTSFFKASFISDNLNHTIFTTYYE